jgi:hypothetical protein
MMPTSETLSSKLDESIRNDVICNSDLPKTYNETKIVILPQDPIWIYTYWEISEDTVKKTAEYHGENFDSYNVVIRVYDITGIDFDGSNAHRYFDINVHPLALSWYINVGEYNRSWCVDICYILQNGDFVTIARSNDLTMPRYGVSNISDEQWALLKLEFEKLIKMSEGSKFGANSYDVVKAMKVHWKEFVNLPSSKVFSGSSSLFKSGQLLEKSEMV